MFKGIVADLWVVFVELVLCPLFLFPWPAQLVCSQGMPAGVGCWGDLQDTCLEKKVFVIFWDEVREERVTTPGFLLQR